jgi:hypothetical protein
MSQVVIENDLAERLQEIALRENRPIEEILTSLLDLYAAQTDALVAMDGTFDDEVTDLSSTVRETMDSYYQKKYGRSR